MECSCSNNNGFVVDSAFNRYVNLDNIEWHIVDYLIKSNSKYADYLWKILKYDTPDCLSKPTLLPEERAKLVYVGNGESTNSRVFISPYLDDSWEEQSSHLHIYIDTLRPRNHISSMAAIAVECIVHNKIGNIYGDASEYNPQTNPSELHNGEFVVPYKARASVMLKCVLGDLNGRFVNGVGTMMFTEEQAVQNIATMSLWNLKKFYGYKIIFSTLISGVSTDSQCGF